MDPKTYKNGRLFDKAQRHQKAWDNAGVIIYQRDGTMCMYQEDGKVSDFGGRKTPRDTDRKATAIRNCLKRSGIELERSQLSENLLFHDGYNIFFTLRDDVPAVAVGAPLARAGVCLPNGPGSHATNKI